MVIRILKVHGHREATLATASPRVPKELFGEVWEQIPHSLRDNHIVVVVRIAGQLYGPERLAIQFSDGWARVAPVDAVVVKDW